MGVTYAVVGAGSLSFQMIEALVERLPRRPASVALVEGLKNPTVVRSSSAFDTFQIAPTPLRVALAKATLGSARLHQKATRGPRFWTRPSHRSLLRSGRLAEWKAGTSATPSGSGRAFARRHFEERPVGARPTPLRRLPATSLRSYHSDFEPGSCSCEDGP